MNMNLRSIFFAAFALSLSVFVACGDSDVEGEYDGSGDFSTGDPTPGSTGSSNTSSTGGSTSTSGTTVTPEPEETFNYRRPQSSRNYVFVANTALDTVAKIDGDTLEITSISVGDRPSVVRTWRETNTAVVLNEGSAEVSVIHADPVFDDVVHLPIREGFNNIVMAPGGEHALAYLDYAQVSLEDDVGKFQDVNLVRLVKGEEAVFNIAVGFRVLEVEFNEDGTTAYIITEDGVSIVDMNEVQRDLNAQPIPLTVGEDVDASALQREVEITEDGAFALVRTGSLEGINVVSLAERRGRLRTVTFPSVPTDLDIYPDSSSAVATLPGTQQVAVLDLSDIADNPEESAEFFDVPEGPVGLSVVDYSRDIALLYSIASNSPEIVRMDLTTGDHEVWDLRKAVKGVQLSLDGARALVFHDRDAEPRSPSAADVFIAENLAYSLVDIETGFTKLQTIPARVGEFVFVPGSDWVFLALEDETGETRQVERVNIASFRVDAYSLASPPAHTGLLPSDTITRVYVSQEHEAGRMTFFEPDSGEARTVTGYELNSRID